MTRTTTSTSMSTMGGFPPGWQGERGEKTSTIGEARRSLTLPARRRQSGTLRVLFPDTNTGTDTYFGVFFASKGL
jgi:hypothetical protein